MSKNSKNLNRNYLSQIYLERFRGYLNPIDINFGKRITLIFGKGSTGKSTILEAIKCLADSNRNQNDLYGIKTKHILSKKSNLKNFKLGFAATETFRDVYYTRKIIRTFQSESNLFYPSEVSLYSLSELNPDKTPLEKNLFVNIKNTIINKNLENSLEILNTYKSEITFADNEYAYKELYGYYLNNIPELTRYLEKCEQFGVEMSKLDSKILSSLNEKEKKINQLKKENNPQIKDKIEKEIDQLEHLILDAKVEQESIFDREYSGSDTVPAYFFPFKKDKIKQHLKFLQNKNISYKDFIGYLSSDIKKEKKYLYKNLRLIDRKIIREKIKRPLNKKELEIVNSSVTFSEFLCYSIAHILKRMDADIYPSRESFIWSSNVSGKTLNVKSMFDSCARTFEGTLNKIKFIKNIEIQQMLANQLNQINLSNPHILIEENQNEINKWLKIFDYDFKISIERTGLNDETEIVHKKAGIKIPASQGGSGAQQLLTFLSSCLGYRNDILLIEEPEKGLHPSLQVKLANFFVKNSESNQLIIETHSENLLLGILKNIREKNLKTDDIKINYVYMENSESKLDELQVDNNGNFLSKWRHGFFTEKLDLI